MQNPKSYIPSLASPSLIHGHHNHLSPHPFTAPSSRRRSSSRLRLKATAPSRRNRSSSLCLHHAANRAPISSFLFHPYFILSKAHSPTRVSISPPSELLLAAASRLTARRHLLLAATSRANPLVLPPLLFVVAAFGDSSRAGVPVEHT